MLLVILRSAHMRMVGCRPVGLVADCQVLGAPLQDRADGLIGGAAQQQRPGTRGFQANRTVLTLEAQQPQAGAVSLFRMWAAAQDAADHLGAGAAMLLAPADQASW